MAVNNFIDLDLYYDDLDAHGNWQYVTLKEAVNNFMFSQDDDSYVGNANRNRVVYQAKRGIQELYFDAVNEIIAIEFELDPSLIIAIPHDYVSYVRISWVDLQGRLHPLAIDKSHNLAQAYLQDDTYEYLYDNLGNILEGTHIQDTVENNPVVDFNTDGIESYVSPYYHSSPPFNTNRSKIFKNGSFKIDKNRGMIQFSSEVDGKIIVLEYLSDGLFQRTDTEIRIHKFAEAALYSYIYHQLVDKKRNVPEREKIRAERHWFNDKRIAKRRITGINYEDVRQVLKSQTRWIKD